MRYRGEIEITKIPKGSYIFLIVICLLYALLVLGFAIAAFVQRGRGRVAEAQAMLAKDYPLAKLKGSAEFEDCVTEDFRT
jgi:hypothetical protein